MTAIFRYKRVRVFPGKHGAGDFRVEFNNANPTHGEFLAMCHWLFNAEDRYTNGQGRALLRRLIDVVYYKDFTLEEAIAQADGASEAAKIYDWEAERDFA